MDGRAFLDVADELAAGATEAHWRTAMGRTYYALMIEGWSALLGWGFTVPPRESAHSYVRLHFVYAADPDLKQVGHVLERLGKWRNQADYQWAQPGIFSSNAMVLQAISLARDAVDLLDRINGDPVRRAAAIASIQP